MHAFVNDSCIGCGLCVSTCPVVFAMGESGQALGGEIPESEQMDAEAAREGCPVDAIDIREA